jgi:branched-chain amino acid transport system ATP-binding protein
MERTGQVILKTVNITKDFGSLRAVDNVNLEMEEGEVRAIIGPNGAGKSTLLDIMTNRSRPTFGRCYFRDREITHLPPFAIAARGVGRCFQVSKLFTGLSVFENVQIACISKWGKVYKLFSAGNHVFKNEVNEILDSIGLREMAEEEAGYLSYGDQRRLEIGITLAMKPVLLLLDEPTAGVSRAEGHDLMRMVRSLAVDQSLTVVFIEHDMDMVFNYADKISVMHLGRLMTTGTPDEIRGNATVRAIYLGERVKP